jgi:phosphoadenosine phosphosulfate reductase
LEDGRCGICDSQTEEVRMTPPGDVRPAFAHDLDSLRKLVDRQFGPGTGDALIPQGEVALLNKIPALDRMDELILDGEVVGTLRYDIGKGFVFLARTTAAKRIQDKLSKGFVTADREAIEFLLKGLNLMAPGVSKAHPDVRAGDEVVVVDPSGRAVCTGTARMNADQMNERQKGMAVKCRWYAEPGSAPRPLPARSLDDVIRANERVLKRRVEEAVTFIRRTVEKNHLPAMVSFSGGKDSLATLLLTLDAGLRLPVFFIDTGLEFPETEEHVRTIAEKHGLQLIVEQAPEGAFYGNLDYFGPPGRDFRWCCKTNKLGPTVRAIMKHYPKGVLSFIGQRRYESEQRSEKPRVWKNPWTPGQIGASPIQDWTALHVWLYIFSKGEEYNPWYDRGLDRIGCYLCPASDLAELEVVESGFPGYARWRDELQRYEKEGGLPQAWSRYALWRWRRLPDSIRKELEGLGVSVTDLRPRSADKSEGKSIRLKMQEGFSPCIMGFSVEGAFSRGLDLERVAEVLNQLGEVEFDREEGWCLALNVRIFAEGALVAKGKDQAQIEESIEKVRRAVVKAEECVGCGVCIARCDEGALTLEQGRLRVSKERCTHCGRCIEPCPALSFGDSAFEM